jgi:hypothetical protein
MREVEHVLDAVEQHLEEKPLVLTAAMRKRRRTMG